MKCKWFPLTCLACNPAVARKQTFFLASCDYTSEQLRVYCLDKHLPQPFSPQERIRQECRAREAKQKAASFFPSQEKRPGGVTAVVKDRGQFPVWRPHPHTQGWPCPEELMSSPLQSGLQAGLFSECSCLASKGNPENTLPLPEKAILARIYRWAGSFNTDCALWIPAPCKCCSAPSRRMGAWRYPGGQPCRVLWETAKWRKQVCELRLKRLALSPLDLLNFAALESSAHRKGIWLRRWGKDGCSLRAGVK